MKKYAKPSRILFDFRCDLIGVQQSCSGLEATLTLNPLCEPNFNPGCGQVLSGDATFCLSGTSDISSQLNGLIVELSTGNQGVLSNCGSGGQSFCSPGSRLYTCDTDTTDFTCILNIHCADGTVLTACPSNAPCDCLG